MIDVSGLGQPGREVEEGREDGQLALLDGLITERRSQMRLPDAGGPDQDEVGGPFQELGLHILHDLLPGDLGIERPVELLQPARPGQARHLQQVGQPALLPRPMLLLQELLQDRPLGFGERLRTLQQPELLPQLREGHRSHPARGAR